MTRHPQGGAGHGDLGVHGRVGGHADHVEFFVLQHLPPVGVGAGARAPGKALPPPGIAVAAGYHLQARMFAQGLHVGPVQVFYLLSQGVAGDLVRRADEA